MADTDVHQLTPEELTMASLLLSAFNELSQDKPPVSVVRAALAFAGYAVACSAGDDTSLAKLVAAVREEIAEEVQTYWLAARTESGSLH